MTIAADHNGHVLCLAGWWPNGTDVNGIFIREHVKAIARTRPVVVVHLHVSKSNGIMPTVDVQRILEDGLPVFRVHIRTPLRRFGLYGFLVRRAYRKLIEELHCRTPFTLVHVHVRTEVTEHAPYIAERLDLPVVVTEHNSFYHLGIRSLPPAMEAAQRRSIRHWFGHPRIAAVMPVSKDLARVLRDDFGVPQEKITVVPNIAADVFRYAPAPPPEPIRLVLAAVWRPPKDHDVFIKALQLIPLEILHRCRIDWVGYGPDHALIVERCKNELPDADIRFPGALNKQALAHLMQQGHLFILPTKADNLPCVVIESLCCGTPVLSMAVNGLPELVDPTNGALVPPRDPQALADALVEILQRPRTADRRTIAENAQAKYSEAAVGAQIIQVYHRSVAAVK